MTAPGRAATLPKRRRRTAIGAGLGLAVLIASSPAWAAFIESPTNQALAQSGAPPRRVAQSSANPRPFRPAPPPPPRPKPSPMPNVTGKPLALAMAILARQGLAASQVPPTASDAPANWVVGQQPFPQVPVTPGARIVLTVSNGPPRPIRPPPPPIFPPRPMQPPPPPIFPPRRPPAPPPNGFNGGVPLQPPAAAPSPPASASPPTLESPPVAQAPVRPRPLSSAPAPGAAPVASAAPSNASAASAANPAVPPAPVAPPNPGPTDQADALGWARAHPGWLAALVAALVAGAAGLGWALRRRPPVIPTGPVLPTLPVIVAVSLAEPPRSEIQTPQPPPGPAIGLSWRLDPPEARIEGPSQSPEDPSP